MAGPGEAMRILTFNSGSSSLKAATFEGDGLMVALTAHVSRIGLADARVRITEGEGAVVLDREIALPDHEAAVGWLLEWLAVERASLLPEVVGHRVVHGGGVFWEPALVTAELIITLARLTGIDPEHMPHALAGIRAVARAFPGALQVACFDTAFHRHLSSLARRYAVPQALVDAGVIRYGFHGLSYEYVMGELARLDPARASGRVILAHLGNGASMAAVKNGRSVDRSMGFSPTAGLVMGTRSGDLDPTVPLYLIRERAMTPDAISRLINHGSGLLGVSGTSKDMRELLDREPADPQAREAVDLFCYRARKYVGAYAAALGGLDAVVFTGGIGENAAAVRERILAGTEFLGIELDPARNGRNEPLVSTDASRVSVRVIRTDEEVTIARHAARLASRGAAGARRAASSE